MSNLFAIVLVVTLVVLGLTIVFWYQRKSEAQWANAAAKFERRQRSPQLAEIEKHLGHALPSSLYALYKDKLLALSENILIGVPNPVTEESECYVAWFEPADLENLLSPLPGCEELFPIANNGAGDQFLVNLREIDPEVIYNLHETGERHGIGVTLSALLAAPRREVPDE